MQFFLNYFLKTEYAELQYALGYLLRKKLIVVDAEGLFKCEICPYDIRICIFEIGIALQLVVLEEKLVYSKHILFKPMIYFVTDFSRQNFEEFRSHNY